MELKDVLGEIEADGANLVHERLLEWALTPPLWHADAVGGVHTIKAILASLINTAKLNDLDPQTYLADVLERMISGRTPVNRLDELLAWNWKAARATMATAA
jgi:hypothetical protein